MCQFSHIVAGVGLQGIVNMLLQFWKPGACLLMESLQMRQGVAD